MVIATLYFSDQARKAFRKTRLEMVRSTPVCKKVFRRCARRRLSTAPKKTLKFPRHQRLQPRCQRRAVAFTSALARRSKRLVIWRWQLSSAQADWLAQCANLFGTAVSLGLIITFLAYVSASTSPSSRFRCCGQYPERNRRAERIFGLLDEKPAIVMRPKPSR